MADETCTIRTSTGQLFGRFTSRDEAWAVIERIRRDRHHRESVQGANVVPLLDSIEPKPIHQGWLSDADEAPAAEMDCPNGAGCEHHPMGHYRGQRERLDRQEILGAVDKLIGAYNDARSLRRGYRYVSGYLLTSDPDLGEAVRVLLDPLYREVEQLTAERSDELEQARTERDAARAEVDQLRTELAAFTVCPVCCSPPSEPCEHNART